MEKHLRIGEAGIATGLSPKTIRYYEEINIIPKPKRTNGGVSGPGYRVYSAEDIERLQRIKRARWLDFSLAEIKQLFSPALASSDARREKMLTIFEQKLEAIDRHVEELKQLKVDFQRMKNRLTLPVLEASESCCEPLCGPETCGGPQSVQEKEIEE